MFCFEKANELMIKLVSWSLICPFLKLDREKERVMHCVLNLFAKRQPRSLSFILLIDN